MTKPKDQLSAMSEQNLTLTYIDHYSMAPAVAQWPMSCFWSLLCIQVIVVIITIAL